MPIVLHAPGWRLATFLVAMTTVGMAAAADLRLGDLPPGALSTSEMSDIAAEICRDHLVDPKSATMALPAGYRLLTAAELAPTNASVAALVREHPTVGSHALGSLCFVSAGSFVVDGVQVRPSERLSLAFWWVVAEGPRHADMRGKARWVQAGSWYSARAEHRDAILHTDPMARFAELDVEQAQPNVWRMKLALPTETVVAEVRSAGNSTPSSATEPGFMSVPMSGGSADRFTVYTYFGHRYRRAEGDWHASGMGTFTRAFSIPNESSVFDTVFEEGWSSRSGLYRFAPR